MARGFDQDVKATTIAWKDILAAIEPYAHACVDLVNPRLEIVFEFEDEAKTKPKVTDSSAIERKMVQYIQVADKPEQSHIAITHAPSNPEQYAIIERWFASGFAFYVAVLNKTHY